MHPMPRPPLFEIPVDDPDTARRAAAYADRLEVCRDLAAEGLTPEPGLVAEIVEASRADGHRPAIAVLFQEQPPPDDRRALTPADFAARPADLVRLARLAPGFAEAGADAIVLGFVGPSGDPDGEAVAAAVRIAGEYGLAMAFHRAFDLATDPARAAAMLAELGVDRTLAAGSPGYDASVASLGERVARLGRAAEAVSDDVFAVVSCGGVRSTNAHAFAKASPHVHASCRRRPSALELGLFDDDEAASLRAVVHGR